MPLYDYKCPKCNNFEKDRLVRWDAVHNCGSCGAESTRQLSVPGNVTFSGAPFSASSKAGKVWARAETESGKVLWEQKVDAPKKFEATEAEQAYIDSIKND